MNQLVRQIQIVLFERGHKITVDGIPGDETYRATLAELTGKPDMIPTPGGAPFALRDPAKFFAAIKPKLFPTGMNQSQVDGTNAILDGIKGQPLSYQAAMLATAYWEAARKMQPIPEYGKGKGRKYGKPGRNGGQVPYGRGLVQTTWDENYERTDRELGLNGRLIANYDLLLTLPVAVPALVRGMTEGWYTTKKLSDFLPSAGPATLAQFKATRTIINGHDKDDEIAAIAVVFQQALQAGA